MGKDASSAHPRRPASRAGAPAAPGAPSARRAPAMQPPQPPPAAAAPTSGARRRRAPQPALRRCPQAPQALQDLRIVCNLSKMFIGCCSRRRYSADFWRAAAPSRHGGITLVLRRRTRVSCTQRLFVAVGHAAISSSLDTWRTASATNCHQGLQAAAAPVLQTSPGCCHTCDRQTKAVGDCVCRPETPLAAHRP